MDSKLFKILYPNPDGPKEYISFGATPICELHLKYDVKYKLRFVGTPIAFWFAPKNAAVILDPLCIDYSSFAWQGPDLPAEWNHAGYIKETFYDKDVVHLYSAFVLDRNDNNELKLLTFSHDVFDQLANWGMTFGENTGGQNGPNVIIRYNSMQYDSTVIPLDRAPFTPAEVAMLKASVSKELLLSLKAKRINGDKPLDKAAELEYLREQLYDIHAIPGHPNASFLLARWQQLTGNKQPGFWIK